MLLDTLMIMMIMKKIHLFYFRGKYQGKLLGLGDDDDDDERRK